ncbi:MAG: chloride channel protein [Bacteroidales bacterium]|nr:chloride channel protein [Bacteroidales bacterium]
MASILVGALAGLAAVLLKNLVHLTNKALLSLEIQTFVGGNALMLVYPMAGIALTIFFVKRILKGHIGHGIPGVLFSISRHNGKLPLSGTYSSIVASTLTVAFGGSVGLEAPIATTGSAIGSNIGRLLHLPSKHIKLLLGCGAAGAIAGIFKAPLAGILFVVEVLLFDLTSTTAIPLLLSTISASTVAYFLMGPDVQFAFQVAESFQLSQIPFYIALGIFCAWASVYFLRTTDRVENWFSRRSKSIYRLLIGGILLGFMIFLFPPLFGEGYGSLAELLHGSSDSLFQHSIFQSLAGNEWAVLAMLLALILLKAVATATTIGSGGVGGTFGPSLILGGLCGYFLATFSNLIGLPPQSAANFALVGMAGVMTGVMHAPLMATFLIAEITGGYALMPPLLITVVVSYLFVHPYEKHSIYARKLAQHGDLLTHDKDQSAWQLLDMQKLIETNFTCVRQGDKLRQLVEAIKESHRNVFPVLDKEGKFVGVIHLDDVRNIMFQTDEYDIYNVEELMTPISEGDIVRNSDTLIDVVNKFRVGNRYNLIVIDKDNRYVGFISRANTFSAYRRFISETSEE